MARTNREMWLQVAIDLAHDYWDCCDEENHDRVVDMADRIDIGADLTEQEWAELEEHHEYRTEQYGDDAWWA